MDCRTLRERWRGSWTGPGDGPEQAAEAAAHLAGCAECRHAIELERELDRAIGRMPRQSAPPSLRRRIAAAMPRATATATAAAAATGAMGSTAAESAPRARENPVMSAPAHGWRPRPVGRWQAAAGGAGIAAVAALALALVVARPGARPSNVGAGAGADLIREVVNDHLRSVNSVHPVEIESGGIHQVKPWFTGRLEFAPLVAFSGDADFALLGGSVGYVHDRKAAVFTFKRRLHTITLLVFPHDGLPWPEGPAKTIADAARSLSVVEARSRGFAVLLWREGDLGYALVSDVSSGDLEALALRLDRE